MVHINICYKMSIKFMIIFFAVSLEGKYESQGKLGAALLANHQTNDVRTFIFVTSPQFNKSVYFSFISTLNNN